jgi:signal transduction histidine kinase
VARLSAGQFDVVLPRGARDEFGTLAAAFNQMVQRVRDMIVARDQLLLDVSHELRSPLTRLKVALELLPPGERRQQMTADVAEMEIMIAELLELERLRDGRGLQLARQDLLPVLRDVAERFRDRAPGVRLTLGTQELPLDIDVDKLRIVFRNLLENAIKYSLPDSRPVQVSAAADADSVVVRVSDDGPGIPDGDLANVFEPFFRVDRSRSKKTGGYGLGLSICKRIVEAHGGAIAVENNPGRGASFIVSLPRPR